MLFQWAWNESMPQQKFTCSSAIVKFNLHTSTKHKMVSKTPFIVLYAQNYKKLCRAVSKPISLTWYTDMNWKWRMTKTKLQISWLISLWWREVSVNGLKWVFSLEKKYLLLLCPDVFDLQSTILPKSWHLKWTLACRLLKLIMFNSNETKHENKLQLSEKKL